MRYLNYFKFDIVFSRFYYLLYIYTIYYERFWLVVSSSLFLSLYLEESFLSGD